MTIILPNKIHAPSDKTKRCAWCLKIMLGQSQYRNKWREYCSHECQSSQSFFDQKLASESFMDGDLADLREVRQGLMASLYEVKMVKDVVKRQKLESFFTSCFKEVERKIKEAEGLEKDAHTSKEQEDPSTDQGPQGSH